MELILALEIFAESFVRKEKRNLLKASLIDNRNIPTTKLFPFNHDDVTALFKLAMS